MFGLAQHEKFTYEHYLLLPEGDRRELLEGELLMTPAPSEKHQRISGNLSFALMLFLKASPVGVVYVAPFDVILDDYNVVQPDMVVILNEHRSFPGERRRAMGSEKLEPPRESFWFAGLPETKKTVDCNAEVRPQRKGFGQTCSSKAALAACP